MNNESNQTSPRINLRGKIYNIDPDIRCSMRDCRKPLEGETAHIEFPISIQDSVGEHGLDGEEHYVYLCTNCYSEIQKKFMGHVISSYHAEVAASYEPYKEDEFDEDEKIRYHPNLMKRLLKK